MLNFAEQTGSGAVMIVWSFLLDWDVLLIMDAVLIGIHPNSHWSPSLVPHKSIF